MGQCVQLAPANSSTTILTHLLTSSDSIHIPLINFISTSTDIFQVFVFRNLPTLYKCEGKSKTVYQIRSAVILTIWEEEHLKNIRAGCDIKASRNRTEKCRRFSKLSKYVEI